jgi:hypothetical protein
MSGPRFQRERRFILIAVVAALALTLCLTPAGIRATGIYAYACLVCGQVGGLASDRMARWLIYVAHAPGWLIYLASYAVFLATNAVFYFGILWSVSAILRLVARVIMRQRSPVGRT